MQELDDIALLREYVERDSEPAFATLVTRHIDRVYSVALRHTRNPHSAEEITQAVLVILAHKSKKLRKGVILEGWLYQTARLTAVTHIRSEIRRARREQEAHMQNTLNENESDVWPQIAPLLDAGMDGLSETDRHAVVLRFFDGKSMKEIGAALGASEDAVKMRVNRAVEKLRLFFIRRGVVLPAAVLTAAISANSIQAAPALLAKTATVVAFAKGATASTSTLALIKGALKLMAWTKMKTAIVVGLGVLLAAGTTTITVNEIETHKQENSWRVPNLNSSMVEKTPPQVRILPTKFHDPQEALDGSPASEKVAGIRVRLSEIVWVAYNWPPARILFEGGEPQDRYDFVSTLPQGAKEALQQELKKQFGLVGQRETRDTDALVLTVRNPNAPGLKPPIPGGGNDWSSVQSSSGQYHCDDRPLSNANVPQGISLCLENYFGVPVIDKTGLTQHFKIDLHWNEQGREDPNHNSLKQVLLDQLGLELVSSREPVEMLVMEKVKD
jgi:uncharacterized protein (TIGR03435 family)